MQDSEKRIWLDPRLLVSLCLPNVLVVVNFNLRLMSNFLRGWMAVSD